MLANMMKFKGIGGLLQGGTRSEEVFDTHQLVFAGGTALAKSGVILNRMSEDVDIKLVPNAGFRSMV